MIFGEDPGRYLRALGLTVMCPVHPRWAAVLDSSLRVWINHEVHYFSDRGALEKFTRAPRRYCGRLTDPVSLARLVPSARSPRLDYRGRTYFFRSDSTRAVFATSPDGFAVRSVRGSGMD